MEVQTHPLSQALAETILWCSPRVRRGDPKWSLRSASLRPPQSALWGDDPSSTIGLTPDTIQQGIETRRHLLSQREPLPTTLQSPKGRLLLHHLHRTNHNGLTQHLTEGLFDFEDVPPWDTWVGYIGGVLVAWIPKALEAAAQVAIESECMGILAWADAPPEGAAYGWARRAASDVDVEQCLKMLGESEG